jgi:putative ABC transport system permease protein
LFYDKEKRWLTIVGVVADVRYRGFLVDPLPQLFLPLAQAPHARLPYQPTPILSLIVRTSVDPASMLSAVQSAIWSVDRDQTIAYIGTMEQGLANTIADRRVYLLLLGIFAVVALVMAAAGLYGLISYAVARRTQEIGIRVALGASTRQILSSVLRTSVLLTLTGIALGIAGSLGMTHLLSGLLFGITATDAATFTAAVLLFLAISVIATYVPARRATKIDPTIALRLD